MKWYTSILIALLTLAATVTITAAPAQKAIVWLTDTSGSMSAADPDGYWREAVSLGLDLAPAGTKAAFLSVSDTLTYSSPFSDMANPTDKAAVRSVADGAQIAGNTDFALGLSSALDLLADAGTSERHIFFIGDFIEAGFVYSAQSYDGVPGTLAALADRMAAEKVTPHFLFLRSPTDNQSFVPLWEELAAATGGEITYIDNPAGLCRAVGDLYLEEFDYTYSLTTGVNTGVTAQDIPVRLPSFAISRARLYISSDAPLTGLKAHADGVLPAFSEGNAYAFMELTPPFPPTVTLTLPPESAETRIYLLADAETEMTAAAESIVENTNTGTAAGYRQKTTVTLHPTVQGVPLFAEAPEDDGAWRVTVTDPNGDETDITTAWQEETLTLEFYPTSFGNYAIDLTARDQGIVLSASASAAIEEMPLPVMPPVVQPQDYSLLIAIIIGLLLILLATIIAVLQRRKARLASVPVHVPLEASYMPPTEPAGVLNGKLDVYGVIVDDGKTELPPTSLRLDKYEQLTSVTLAQVLEQSGVPYRYPAANHIRLVSGPDNTMIVENHSDAVVYRGAQAFLKGQKTALIYGQKMRAVFEADVSEYEIYYHNAVDMAVSGRHFSI